MVSFRLSVVSDRTVALVRQTERQMDMDAPRPSWQHSPCPPWCQGGHREDDLCGDRVHRSAGVEETLQARRTHIVRGALEVATGPEEFTAGLARSEGEDTTWLYVGAGAGQQIEIALDDLPRLREIVARALGEV